MASLPNSESSPLGSICLPLVKFSHATVPISSVAPVPWIHISSTRELFASFDTLTIKNSNGTNEERKKFRVLRDPEVMVTILASLAPAI
jgi:hypothetical protein